MAKNIGVILSGCGVYDGSEIHEAVITLLALDRAKANVVMMAPDMNQKHVINHLTGEVAEGETRNVLVESARIARGNIKDIKDVQANDLDGMVLPGGFGAAKNLTNFADEGLDCEIHREVRRLLKQMVVSRKPIAAICIAPVLLSRVLGDEHISHEITIGTDKDTAQTLQMMGSTHKDCNVDRVVVDVPNKIITTPAYMLASSISEAAEGIEEAIERLMDFVNEPPKNQW
jgi:enhancing lycopene biosynthesis protein 2